jgi:hypothetical protein
MDLQDLYNFVDFWSRRGDMPGMSPQVTNARDAMKDTGKVVDDYVLGGTYQANMRGQDALLRQLALNAAAGGVGAGVGAGAAKATTKLAPKVAALMQWIKPRDIGVHMSPYDDLPQILPNINKNKGAGEVPGFPLIEGQTYKLSSTNAFNQKLNPNELINSVENYLPNIPINPMGNKNIYITKSATGLLDPEHQYYVDAYNNVLKSGQPATMPGSLNARMIPSQKVVGSQTLTPLQQGVKLDDDIRNSLLDLIKKQQSLERMKSLARGTAVGGTAVGTALTPLAVARPALGFNNKK